MEKEWLSAKDARELAKKYITNGRASRDICGRAYSGLLQARARLWIFKNTEEENAFVPKFFWWAKGEAALKQNWATGDFETRINGKHRLQAFGVEFKRQQVLEMLGIIGGEEPTGTRVSAPKGGRPPADWWEDLWIEICTQLYVGDLHPKVQADVEKAMHKWLRQKGFSAANSTIRERASKLNKSLQKRG